MKEIVSAVTDKGQVTIPVEVRNRLGLGCGQKAVFQIEDDEVRLRPERFTLESVFGSVPALSGRESDDFEDQIEEAMEEEAKRIVSETG